MTALFFNHVWQSTLSAGVIAVVAFALRHNRARLRYGLWLAASVKFLVPFAAMAAVGGLVQWQQAPLLVGVWLCGFTAIAFRGVKQAVAYAAGIVAVCRRYVEAPLMSVAGVGGADVKARIDAIPTGSG